MLWFTCFHYFSEEENSRFLTFILFVCFFFYYRSNLVGTRFTVFNSGVNPKKGGVMSDGSNIREEVAAIIYVSTTEHSHKGPVT